MSTLRFRGNLPGSIVVSYDIACQWERYLFERALIYPHNPLAGPGEQEINWTFCVPKFHLPAHVGPCQLTYLFNLTPGVGRLEGEAPERLWVPADRLAAATMQMGPGGRRDVVNDDFGDWNWTKVVGMCTSSGDQGIIPPLMSLSFSVSTGHRRRGSNPQTR